MKQYEFGDVVLVEMWRDDGKGKKVRPCIILQDCVGGFEVAPITSQYALIGGKLNNEVIVMGEEEKTAMGLWKDSRLSMKNRDLRTVRYSTIIRKIGKTPYAVLGRCAMALKDAMKDAN